MSRFHGSRHHRLLALAGVLGLLAPLGCMSGAPDEEGDVGESEAPLNLARRAEQLPVYETSPEGGQQGQLHDIRSDAEVAGALKAANLAEIEYAQMACVDAESEDVQSFAEIMITHHIDALARQGLMFQRYGIVPADSARARAFVTEMNGVFAGARDAQGAELDREFMEGQVEFHLALLDLVDTQLLPAVQHKALRAELDKVRTSTLDHLQQAHDLHCALTGEDPSQDPGTPDLIIPGHDIDLDRTDDLLTSGHDIDLDRTDDLLNSGHDIDLDRTDDLLNSGHDIDLDQHIDLFAPGHDIDLDRSDDLVQYGGQVGLDVNQGLIGQGGWVDLGLNERLLREGGWRNVLLSFELLRQAGRFDMDLDDDDRK